MSALCRVSASNPKGALDALRANGCVVITKALHRGWLQGYAAEAQRFHEHLAALDPAQIAAHAGHLRGMKHIHSIQSGFDLSPILMFEMPIAWLPASIIFLIRNSPLAEIGRRYLGSSSCGFMLDAASVRVQPPDQLKRALAWHQDAFPASIRSERDRGVAFWVPLSDIDDATPTLEVFPAQLDEIFATRTDDSYYAVLADEPAVLSRMEVKPERVDNLRVGDVLVLDCFTLHRTCIPQGATKTRISADIRMRPLAALSRDYPGHVLS
jgi:hypothetical protein